MKLGAVLRGVLYFQGLQVRGRVAQLGERGVRNAEVEGSNPFASTNGLLFNFFSVRPQLDLPGVSSAQVLLATFF
jgi:hypothetical protein